MQQLTGLTPAQSLQMPESLFEPLSMQADHIIQVRKRAAAKAARNHH
jgi:hypothetical protein